MKRTIGIILLIIGIGLGIYGFVSLDDDKSVLEIGDMEINAEQREASDNTVIIFVLSGIAVVGGVLLMSGKRT